MQDKGFEPLPDEADYAQLKQMQKHIEDKQFWLVLFTTDTAQPTTLPSPFASREQAESYARNTYPTLRFFVGTKADIDRFNARIARLQRIDKRTEQITQGTAKVARGLKKGFLEPDVPLGKRETIASRLVPYTVKPPRQGSPFRDTNARWGPVQSSRPSGQTMGNYQQPQGFMFLSNREHAQGLGRKTGRR